MKVIAAAVLFAASLFPPELGAQTITNEVNSVQVRHRVPPTNASTPPDDISAYDKRDLLGWRVLVNQKLIAQTNLCLRTMRLLGSQLHQIAGAVPARPLAKLREIPIWVELNDTLFPCMCYHEDINWLREHGVNPDKARSVELANATNFLEWTRDQPWMALHELAHGYHQRTLGDDARIRKCYEHAKSERLYESVLRINGKHERHYAMNNEKEYFAEMTEAFFGTNDFFPFVRAELKEHDPQMFDVLREVWEINSSSPRREPPDSSGYTN